MPARHHHPGCQVGLLRTGACALRSIFSLDRAEGWVLHCCSWRSGQDGCDQVCGADRAAHRVDVLLQMACVRVRAGQGTRDWMGLLSDYASVKCFTVRECQITPPPEEGVPPTRVEAQAVRGPPRLSVSRANWVMRSQSPVRTAETGASQEPPRTPHWAGPGSSRRCRR